MMHRRGRHRPPAALAVAVALLIATSSGPVRGEEALSLVPPLPTALAGIGLVLFSSLLDEEARNEGLRLQQRPGARRVRDVGDALPLAGFALVTWQALGPAADAEVPEPSRAALRAGLWAVGAAGAVKLGVARARPSTGRGPGHFDEDSRVSSAFPSIHTALSWAVVTPYAEHHDAAWLYGVVALTNASRVIGRKHWLSDTVGGAALGWWMGQVAWQQERLRHGKTSPVRWLVAPGLVAVQMVF